MAISAIQEQNNSHRRRIAMCGFVVLSVGISVQSPLRRSLGTRAGGFARSMSGGIKGCVVSSAAGRLVTTFTPTSNRMGLDALTRSHARRQFQWHVHRIRRPLWVGAGFSAQLTLDRPVRINCSVKRVEPAAAWAFPSPLPKIRTANDTRS